ncbi:hypothetical protein KUCAC02_017806, partial [Chaenocephalus aceratus]
PPWIPIQTLTTTPPPYWTYISTTIKQITTQTVAQCRDCRCETPLLLIPSLLFILLSYSPLVPQFTPVHMLPLPIRPSPPPLWPPFPVPTMPSIFTAFTRLSPPCTKHFQRS